MRPTAGAGDCPRSAAHKAVEDPCDLHMAGHRLVGSSETGEGGKGGTRRGVSDL